MIASSNGAMLVYVVPLNVVALGGYHKNDRENPGLGSDSELSYTAVKRVDLSK